MQSTSSHRMQCSGKRPPAMLPTVLQRDCEKHWHNANMQHRATMSTRKGVRTCEKDTVLKDTRGFVSCPHSNVSRPGLCIVTSTPCPKAWKRSLRLARELLCRVFMRHGHCPLGPRDEDFRKIVGSERMIGQASDLQPQQTKPHSPKSYLLLPDPTLPAPGRRQ